MSRLVIVVEVDLPPAQHGPEEVADDLFAHGQDLPTFGPDEAFTAADNFLRGRFITATWST